jgi:hypothetical protein
VGQKTTALQRCGAFHNPMLRYSACPSLAYAPQLALYVSSSWKRVMFTGKVCIFLWPTLYIWGLFCFPAAGKPAQNLIVWLQTSREFKFET